MSDVQITVRGTARATNPPERATVHVNVNVEGSDRADVQARAARLAEAVGDSITPLTGGGGAVTRWNTEQLYVHSHAGGGRGGQRPDQVHTAGVVICVRFRDFDALSSWLTEMARLDGVNIHHARWSLTRATHDELTTRVRAEAVRDAQRRAADYARELGLTDPRPVAVADPGLLAPDVGGGSRGLSGAAASRYVGEEDLDIGLTPQDLEVTAAVDMRFVAG